MFNNGIQSYRKTNVITADPKRLVLMLYEGAIESLKLAKDKMVNEEFEAKSKAIIKAQNIINELLCSLDFEKGGRIATNLDSLYNYMLRKIMHADLSRDISAIDEVLGMLDELHSAWKTIFSQQNQKPASESIRFVENKSRPSSSHIAV